MASPSGAGGAAPAIDDALYSRQLYVMGHAAQARMQQSDVLLVGLRGIGVELAKNIILMGVKSVTLFDPEPTSWSDLSAQFYLGPSDVGAPRADRSVAKLAELNQYVKVGVLPEVSVDAAVVSRFDVVVATDQSQAELLRLNGLTRALNKRFVCAESMGLFGRIFSDFGASFRVDDVNGENPVASIVESISNENPGRVRLVEETRHGLETGDYVSFREVEGMSELNDSAPRPVKVVSPYEFTIEDTTAYGKHTRGGIVQQVKMPVDISMKPLESMLLPVGAAGGPDAGEFVLSDFGKMDRIPVLHAAFSALHELIASSGGAVPAPGDEAAAQAVLAATQSKLSEPVTDAQKGFVLQLGRGAAGHLSPMAAALGGIAAQEVIKAVSGKFMPLRQWFYFDASEAAPRADAPLPASEVAPTGSRYDGQIAVFGRSFQERVLSLRYFLVGAGAIGCEMLKNWAVMGVGCGETSLGKGMVTVTDMDRIEKSNLSRQFLFRTDDIGKAKSTTAIAAAARMNPDLRAVAFETRVGPDTESIFNDGFWNGLSGVCTALDNVDARLYVDGRCVYYGKPMLESGTLGTKGNTQVVVPRLTENYGASRDPPEQSIPVCTLKNFPNKIDHTLQWARDWFEGEFKQLPDAVNAYLTQPNFLELLGKQSSKIETLEKIKAALVTEKPTSVEECVAWARLQFQQHFHNTIAQLLHNFPPDSRTSTGEMFWSGPKRQPEPLKFDAADPAHMSFIATATHLRASMYGLTIGAQHTADWFKSKVSEVHVPAFSPAEGVKIAASDKELEEQKKAEAEKGGAAAASGGDAWDTDARAAALAGQLPPPRELAGFCLHPAEFEKDDDLHISVVTACSNLRARNYRIKEEDKHTSKGIAGKIIPAIATTTALVTGLVCLELYKLLQNRPLEDFRNCYANLAIPVFAFSEPVPVKKALLPLPEGTTFSPPAEPGSTAASAAVPAKEGPGREWHWSVWDRIDLSGPMTLRELLDFLQSGVGLDVQMVCFGPSMLFNFLAKPAVKKERMPMTLAKLAQHIAKRALPSHARFITLEVSAVNEGGESIELPYIRYALGQEEIVVADEQGVASGTVVAVRPSAATPAAEAAGAMDVDMAK